MSIDPQICVGLIGAAGAMLIVFRRKPEKPLPPPVPDSRDTITQWRQFWKDASRE